MAVRTNQKTVSKKVSGEASKEKFLNKRRLIRWSPLIVILSLAALYMAALGVYKANLAFHQYRMTRYLEHKYGKQFVVRNVDTEDNGIGSLPTIVGEGSPKDEPGVRFRIEDVHFSYADQYLGALWAYQDRDKITTLLNEIYVGNKPKFEVQVRPPDTVYKNEVHGNIPDFVAMQQKYPGEILYDITIDLHDADNEATRRIHAEHVYRVIEYLKSRPVLKPSLTYRVFTSGGESYRDSFYGCSLLGDEFGRAQTIADAMACFKPKLMEK